MDVSEFMNKCKYFDLDCVSLEKIVQSANRKTQAPDAESKQIITKSEEAIFNEICQKSHIKATHHCDEILNGGQKSFLHKISFGDFQVEGIGTNKKEAKKNAVIEIVKQIRK
ncbi:hypothetical protein BLOT_004656 [Blomia tropicalis]|nr:hypothetical protein BLOT_004656 [Blomia tropicalis]